MLYADTLGKEFEQYRIVGHPENIGVCKGCLVYTGTRLRVCSTIRQSYRGEDRLDVRCPSSGTWNFRLSSKMSLKYSVFN